MELGATYHDEGSRAINTTLSSQCNSSKDTASALKKKHWTLLQKAQIPVILILVPVKHVSLHPTKSVFFHLSVDLLGRCSYSVLILPLVFGYHQESRYFGQSREGRKMRSILLFASLLLSILAPSLGNSHFPFISTNLFFPFKFFLHSNFQFRLFRCKVFF